MHVAACWNTSTTKTKTKIQLFLPLFLPRSLKYNLKTNKKQFPFHIIIKTCGVVVKYYACSMKVEVSNPSPSNSEINPFFCKFGLPCGSPWFIHMAVMDWPTKWSTHHPVNLPHKHATSTTSNLPRKHVTLPFPVTFHITIPYSAHGCQWRYHVALLCNICLFNKNFKIE